MSLSKPQVRARSRGVGASEVLAALGKDARCSRLELYQRKLGERPPPDFSGDERVRFGNLLEPVIAREFARRIGKRAIKPRKSYRHSSAPLVGHPDLWIPELNRGCEIKTADKFEAADFGEPDSDQVPVRYLVQCTCYMMLTNADGWYLCVLIGGNDLRIYFIPRDAQIESAILAGVQEFWSHIERREPPDPQTPEEVRLRWPKDTGATVTASETILTDCHELANTRAKLSPIEDEERLLKMRVQTFMQDAGQLVDDAGKMLATWRSAKPSKRFDERRFELEQPQLFDQYQREVPGSRRFLLKLEASAND